MRKTPLSEGRCEQQTDPEQYQQQDDEIAGELAVLVGGYNSEQNATHANQSEHGPDHQ